MKTLITSLLFMTTTSLWSQPNCNVYKVKGETKCFDACELAIRASEGQGFWQSQMQFDQAIELCPTFDYAWFEKSVPYLKRGEFITWKKLIDKAVELNNAHLGYRGWCRYQFLRDYQGAIDDIEKYDAIASYDIGYTINGAYHLNIARALAYRGIGQPKRALEIIETQLATANYSPMTYDYMHAGVTCMELNDDVKALEYFQKSISYNDYLAEAHYYLGVLYKKRGQHPEAIQELEKARAQYARGYKMDDPYTQPMDQICLSDIEREISGN
jgi:tetratricopeptide (TPR) repeat protein